MQTRLHKKESAKKEIKPFIFIIQRHSIKASSSHSIYERRIIASSKAGKDSICGLNGARPPLLIVTLCW